MTIIREIVMKSEWIIAVLALYVVAWTRFNSPPTNRSGTTFALFFFGHILLRLDRGTLGSGHDRACPG
jgi:hypothetical protein